MVDLRAQPPHRWNDTLAGYLWLPRTYVYPSVVAHGAWYLLLVVMLLVGRLAPLFAEPVVPTDEAVTPAALTRALGTVSGSRMLADVIRFSQAEFNGRQTGTTDDRRTALLVATLFHSLGLQPAGTEALGPGDEPWAQTTPVTTTRIAEEPLLELSIGSLAIQALVGTDYLPVLDSPAVNVTAPIVFVGYGISDPARGLDEYAGQDVRNRIVMFLRGKPERYDTQVTQAEKERVARERGALAFLTFTGPVLSAYEARRGLGPGPIASYTMIAPGERPIPGCWITTRLAEQLFMAQDRSLREVQERVNSTMKPQSFAVTALARLSWGSTQEPGTLFNVLGALPGDEAARPEEIIVIGAHRDHFGRQAGLLFAGADDNASGTAVLLEAARALAQAGTKPARTILFASFSGEEQNLQGSRLYVSRPARPLSTTKAMINVDHAGIGNGRLLVGVTGLPKSVGSDAGNLAGVAEKLDIFGFFPGGDHVPFKEAGVSTFTVVSAGAHPHFHQPSDRPETVQPEILEAAARYVVTLAWQLANAP